MMQTPQSWSDLSPEQSAGLEAIIADYKASTIDAATAIVRAGDILDIPPDQVPDAMAAMTRAWIKENRELLDWTGSLIP